MEWYFWVLIVVAVIGVGYLKLSFFKKMKEKADKKKKYTDEE